MVRPLTNLYYYYAMMKLKSGLRRTRHVLVFITVIAVQ